MIGTLRRYLSALRRNEQPIRFALGWLLSLTVGRRLVRIDRGTYCLALQPTNLSVQFWAFPHRRRDEERFIASLLREGDHVIDVGANIGSVSCLAASIVGPRGSVLAIEAHPKTTKFLRRNINLNRFKNITVVEMAADERLRTVHFDSRSADDRNAVTENVAAITVPANRIDSLPFSHLRYRLLKIDIEGYELPALRGATGILDRVEGIWFECDRTLMAPYGYKPQDILDFLTAHGYRTFWRDGNRFVEIKSVDDDAHLDLLAARSLSDFPVPLAREEA